MAISGLIFIRFSKTLHHSDQKIKIFQLHTTASQLEQSGAISDVLYITQVDGQTDKNRLNIKFQYDNLATPL